MPKAGFKSFILREEIYNSWYEKYKKNKDQLYRKGITSFSAYLTHVLYEGTKENLINSKQGRFEKVFSDDNCLVIKDRTENKIIEISINGNELFCTKDKRNDCIHVGYAYSIPALIKHLK